ncbi:MAG: hypothetical protein ACMUIS_01965 [bacterium]
MQTTPFTTSAMNSSYYRDIYTTYGTQNTAFSNPFATYGSSSMLYTDPFSQAASNTMSYQNVFGQRFETGQEFYRDPFYAAGGKYTNYSSLIGGFSSEMGYTMTPFGGTTHLGSSLTTPWTHIETNINTAAGIAGAGTSIQHAAFGMPTVYNMMGFNPAVAGQLSLMTYGHETAAMDRMLSNTYAYTKEGMAYIPVASYYNANSVGGTNYFFAGDISYQEAGITPGGSYAVNQEVPSSLVGYAGASLVTSAALSGAFLGAGAATAAPYGGWTGGTTAASTGSGAIYAGWGAAPTGSFGVVSGGWGAPAGGFATGGGVFAGGAGLAGAAFGIGGGGGGATYGGTNVGW